MSRIQNILDKAEREGGVRRMRPMTDTTGGTALAFDVPTMPPPIIEDVVIDAVPASAPSPVTVAAPPPPRTTRATRLDPILVASLAPGAPVAEQYRALRTRIAHAAHGGGNDVILITSPGRGEGKSLTATNLALTMAQDFQTRICIVDADLRHSRLHSLFGIADTPGLADVLTGQAQLSDALVGIEGLQITVLVGGKAPAHPAELLGSTAMRRTIQTLRTQFDRVIIDAPAAGPLADVGILAPLVDSVLLVVQAGVTTKPAIQEAVSAIGPAKLLGVVLNNSAG
jgi:protein-tyrosine kinase